MKYLENLSAVQHKPIRENDKNKIFAVSCGLRQECFLDLFLSVILFDFLPSRINVEKNVVYADDLARISKTKPLTEMANFF